MSKREKRLYDYLALPYTLIVTPDDEGYGVQVQELPGCFTHAETWDDIQPMVRESMSLWIGVMLADGKAIPEPALAPA
jgi:predicted RNase H-like HicB family nuclease